MSTSILYHAFGLTGINYRSAKFIGNKVIITADIKERSVRCPVCGGGRLIFKGQKTRQLIMSPLGRKRCLLNLHLHRLRCNSCNNLWWPRLAFMTGKHRYTRCFALTVLAAVVFSPTRASAAFFMFVLFVRAIYQLLKDISHCAYEPWQADSSGIPYTIHRSAENIYNMSASAGWPCLCFCRISG